MVGFWGWERIETVYASPDLILVVKAKLVAPELNVWVSEPLSRTEIVSCAKPAIEPLIEYSATGVGEGEGDGDGDGVAEGVGVGVEATGLVEFSSSSDGELHPVKKTVTVSRRRTCRTTLNMFYISVTELYVFIMQTCATVRFFVTIKKQEL